MEGAIPGGHRAHAGQGGDAGTNKLAGTVGLIEGADATVALDAPAGVTTSYVLNLLRPASIPKGWFGQSPYLSPPEEDMFITLINRCGKTGEV